MGERQAIVRSNGVDLATRVEGDEGRPWLVLLNSLATHAGMWDGVMPVLTRTHRVLRYDARGHGASGTPPGPYGFPDLVADLLGLMDQYRIGRADLLGLSMGGMTALGAAIHHGDRVRRVICCGARADAVPPFVANWDARIAAIRDAGGIEGVVEASLERWFTPAFRAAHPEAVTAAAAMIGTTDPRGYVACADALKRLDYKRSLGRVAAPALFVCGASDGAAPPAVMREMAALTPGSTYAEVDPGAHLFVIENPDGFGAAVGGWLAATPSA